MHSAYLVCHQMVAITEVWMTQRTSRKFCTGACSEYFRSMYSKQEVSKLKENFWTAFGRYMKPVLSADGEPISWLNYKTGIPGVFFKMDADSRHASISIVITQSDPRFYNQFVHNKAFLETTLDESWQWTANATDEYGKTMSTISTQLEGVNVLNSGDWPEIISFFKPRIIALDEFWSMAKYSFEGLL
ncbi:DUF4268 domain-containing protein [Chitinophaga sancti]|uniref:DUF4268 domain-containing protein n=1 Tax=Chitinophaga sancti TaxID=1004 RepID=UPI003F7A887A